MNVTINVISQIVEVVERYFAEILQDLKRGSGFPGKTEYAIWFVMDSLLVRRFLLWFWGTIMIFVTLVSLAAFAIAAYFSPWVVPVGIILVLSMLHMFKDS